MPYKYKIISEPSLGLLEDEVNRLCIDGNRRKVLGGPFPTLSNFDSGVNWNQAVIIWSPPSMEEAIKEMEEVRLSY